MDPLIVYVLLFVACVAVCFLAVVTHKTPTRACLSCGKDTPVQARRCRHCGYTPARPV